MSSIGTLPTFPTTTDVLASLQSALQALNPLLSNFNAGGATETYLEAASLLVGSDASTYPGVVQQGAYEILAIVQAAEFILTASGNFLDLKAADVGVFRKPAVAATGPVVFYATVSSVTAQVIAAGALVAAENADPTALPSIYTTLTDATIPIGASQSNAVIARAISAGSSGNQQVGAVNTVVSGATGATVLNVQTMAGGGDVEQDDSPNGGLRARALAAIPNASQCTISAVENAGLSYAGISSAVASDINDDPTIPRGVVQLYVDDGSGDLANATNSNYALLTTMQADFDRGLYRAAGIEVNVLGSQLLPTVVTLLVAINSNFATNVSPTTAIIAAVQLAVFNYVQSVGIGKPVLLAEIIRVVAEVPGISDVPITAVSINGAGQNLQPGSTQAPRAANLAAITVTSVLVTY